MGCADKSLGSGSADGAAAAATSPDAPAALATSRPKTLRDEPAASAAASALSTTAAATASPSASAGAELGPNGKATETAQNTGSGGLNDCKLVRGPTKLKTIGAVTIGPGEGGLAAFATNKVGAPAWERPAFAEPSKQGVPTLLPKPSGSVAPSATTTSATEGTEERTRLPACALAGKFTFCTDGEGQIHRRTSQDEDVVVAKGRRGTPVAAAMLGEHTFYAFLANQKTTEGTIVRAFASVDDLTPIPLSEDGSGATFVSLVARETDVLAMYIDARTALTPVHARTLRVESGLVRGADAVVFVGGGADSHVRGALGRGATGPTFLFVPGSQDDKEQGVIAIPIEGEPKDDLPGKWSFHSGSSASTALAATVGVSPLRLVRGRPGASDAKEPFALELGHVARDGTFQAKCALATGSKFSEVSAFADTDERLWVAYTNASGTWVEQRGGHSK